MITNPFNLEKQLSKVDRPFDPVPLLDLCLIGLFFTLYSSRFIFAPGVTIDLPQADEGSLAGLATTAVLTVRENNMILFRGKIFRVETLEPELSDFVQEKQIRDATLLVKVDRNVAIQQVLQICDLARHSGFARVQLATKEKEPRAEFLSTKP